MTSDTRKDKRAKIVSLTVRYKSATVDEFIDNHSFDVSVGGVFVKTPTPFAPGTLLKFELHIAGDYPVIAGVGRVVWKREPTQGAPERPAGMGVKFIKIDDASRQVIDRLVTQFAEAGKAFDGIEEAPTANQPVPAAPAPATKAAPAASTPKAAPAPKPVSPVSPAPKPSPSPAVNAAKAPAPAPTPRPAPAAAMPVEAPAPKPAAAATTSFKATLPLGQPVPKPSAPPPRASVPAPTPVPRPKPDAVSDSIRPPDPRRQTVAGIGIPIGLASRMAKGDVPTAASTQPLGSLSDDDDAFDFLSDLEQKDPAPPTAVDGPPAKGNYPSPFDAEPTTMAKSPVRVADDDPWASTMTDTGKKPSPDESAGFSSTLPLSRDALPDFDGALPAKAAAAIPPKDRPTLPRNADFETTMPLDRAALGLPGSPAKARPAPGPMFPVEAAAPRPKAMFPGASAPQPNYGADRPEPTVMKQAAELLEEALREAGGSLDEIGHNPLFQSAGLKAEGPTVAGAPSDDLLAAVRGPDHRPEASAPHALHDIPTARPFSPDGSVVLKPTPHPPQVGGSSASGPSSQQTPAPAYASAEPQPLAMEEQVRPLPTPKKRSGGGGLAVLAVVVVTALAGGGVWAYKTHAFGIGAPKPPPPMTTASAAPTAAPSASEAAEAGATPVDEAGVSPTAGDASAAVAASASPSTAPSASAALVPPVAPSAAEKPKPVYRPPPPPKPPTTTSAEPVPTEPKAPTPTEPKPTEPKPIEPKPDPKPDPKPTPAPGSDLN